MANLLFVVGLVMIVAGLTIITISRPDEELKRAFCALGVALGIVPFLAGFMLSSWGQALFRAWLVWLVSD